MRVLFAGYLFWGSTAKQRLEALKRIGCEVHAFDYCRFFPFNTRGLHSLERRLCWGPTVSRLNTMLVDQALEVQPQILWLEKALQVSPGALGKLRSCGSQPVLVHHSNDDQFNPKNQSRYYLKTIPLYDVHVTTNPHNVSELIACGANRVILRDFAFCPRLHQPRDLSDEQRRLYGSQVAFAGTFEGERGKSILSLAEAGIEVRVWGFGWDRHPFSEHQNIQVEGRPVWEDEYVCVINATEISLCFLRKSNRDVSTGRTFEIPACGGFMLAERTEKHLSLFAEGKEAVFFSNEEELVEKVRYYLNHAEERASIARAGRKRCLESEYSNDDRLREVLSEI